MAFSRIPILHRTIYPSNYRLYERHNVFTPDILSKIEKGTFINADGPITTLIDATTPCPLQQANYLLSKDNIISFLRKGHVFCPNLLKSEFIAGELSLELAKTFESDRIAAYRHELLVTGSETEATIAAMTVDQLEARMNTEAFPFMQLFNLWRKSSTARSLALHPSLAKIAASLLGVNAVRLYQDSLFVKKPGNGPTQWHSDLNMSPFDSNMMVTCWIPLQPIPSQQQEGTGLSFASESHTDFALLYWNDAESTGMEDRYKIEAYDGYAIGDASFHHGWCLHSAPANDGSDIRMAYSISFIADGIRLLNEDGHIRYPDDEDAQSYGSWLEEVGWGEIARHPMLPLVYRQPSPDKQSS